MSDLFHEAVPEEFLHEVFTTMERAPQHTFQVLTKRPERMLEYVGWRYGTPEKPGFLPARNIQLGVSCKDQPTADDRIPRLLKTPATVPFVSLESGQPFGDQLGTVAWPEEALRAREQTPVVIAPRQGAVAAHRCDHLVLVQEQAR
jgi:protein gp37